jgi:putative exporter of polyketide antibiotics
MFRGRGCSPDFHATILAAFLVDPALELMAGSRPQPITRGSIGIATMGCLRRITSSGGP